MGASPRPAEISFAIAFRPVTQRLFRTPHLTHMLNLQVTVYGSDSCRRTNRARGQLDSLGIPYRYLNIELDREAAARLRRWDYGRRRTPTVILSLPEGERRVVNPSDGELESELSRAGLLPEGKRRLPLIRGLSSLLDRR